MRIDNSNTSIPDGNATSDSFIIDKVVAIDVATSALNKWVKNAEVDSDQISNATLHSIEVKGEYIIVTFSKDNSVLDSSGKHQPEGEHIAFFTVTLNLKYEIVSTQRGPDILT